MKYRILVSDMDGTLLNKEKQISPENNRAIKQMKERGIYFVPSSGRGLSEMPEMENHPDIRFLTYSNGAVVLDKLSGEKSCACIENEQISFLVDALESCDVCCFVHYDGKTYSKVGWNTEEACSYYRMSPYFVSAIEPYVLELEELYQNMRLWKQLEMVTVFFHHDTELNAFQKRLEQTGAFLVAPAFESANLEVFSNKAGKGNGLLRLAKLLKTTTDEVIGVGDSPNDITLLEAAGLSLAMGNACEALKNIADEVICTNDEHAISYILSKYF